MSRPKTLLEDLCAHALSCGAESLQVEHRDGREWVFAIYNYSKIHGRAPSESDLQGYFQTSPPTIHEMIKTLELRGFIQRTPGQARSVRLLVRPGDLPVLE